MQLIRSSTKQKLPYVSGPNKDSHSHSRMSLVFRPATRQVAVLLTLALISAMMAAVWHPRRPPWRELYDASVNVVSASEITQEGQAVLWVHVGSSSTDRSPPFPNELALTIENWEAQLPELVERWSPDVKVVIYGDGSSTDASQAIARRLRRELSFTNVFTLKGGLPSWKK